MKKILSMGAFGLVAAFLFVVMQPIIAEAKESETIKEGVYAGEISLAGLTKEEAEAEIIDYVELLKARLITLKGIEDKAITVTAEELGIFWSNPELPEEALMLGSKGNIIERYKTIKDLKHENKILDIELDFDIDKINNVLVEKCTIYDTPAVDYNLSRQNGEFVISDGKTGIVVDVEASGEAIYSYMMDNWEKNSCSVDLVVEVTEPRGNVELLSKVKDVLGTFSTSYATSNSSRSANVINGCKLINGILLYPGEEFAMLETVTPFTTANGYQPAGSYLNGRVVDSVGGGICQVSTTLYNAVLLAELEMTERYNHSMTVSYVEPAADAAIANSAGKDFKFVNNLEYPVYIEGITTPDKNIIINIYGVETRPANRSIRFESVILGTTPPGAEVINIDQAQPVGYVDVQGAFAGYKAQLWKIVTVDGVEKSRTQINSSNYKMVPRTATVGVVTADPNAYNEIMAAIGTGNIDHVRNVAAYWASLTPQPQPEVSVPAEPPVAEAAP